ncbi:MAG: helix-turn-helix domain-containing protein [Patescibacteria group bacterium]
MNQNIFESVGLSPNEAKIYEALVERGESTISDIAIAAKIHRRNTYDAVNRLIDKGLCFQILSPKENLYNAVDPDKLKELLTEKQQKLDEVLPELKKKFGQRLAPEEAYIYRGLEGQKNIWRDMLRVGGDCYFIGAKGGWFDPRLEPARVAFFKEANRRKIKFINLFDYEVKEKMPGFTKNYPGNLQYRYLPKEYSTTSGIGIYGDYITSYTGLGLGKINENLIFFIIKSRNLAESYRTWFWYMWKQSAK